MSGDQLRKSAIMGDVESLNALLRGGANPCSVDDNGCTALHLASWIGHVEVRGTDLEGPNCGRTFTSSS